MKFTILARYPATLAIVAFRASFAMGVFRQVSEKTTKILNAAPGRAD
ncbi:MAG: hypothetical protein JNN06_16715 [Gemmobacter sp.]|nr:hypothetical protein [Gemmobacter sp.]MBL8563912.1 hypothetical protein [Gemmobacter sp.]